jgi:hypothetical protein
MRPSLPERDEEITVGILKTAATVAVASSVHGRVQRRQQARWAAQDLGSPATVPAPPPQAPVASAQSAGMGEQLAHLAQLGELMKAGVLTEAEFEQQKARILNG